MALEPVPRLPRVPPVPPVPVVPSIILPRKVPHFYNATLRTITPAFTPFPCLPCFPICKAQFEVQLLPFWGAGHPS